MAFGWPLFRRVLSAVRPFVSLCQKARAGAKSRAGKTTPWRWPVFKCWRLSVGSCRCLGFEGHRRVCLSPVGQLGRCDCQMSQVRCMRVWRSRCAARSKAACFKVARSNSIQRAKSIQRGGAVRLEALAGALSPSPQAVTHCPLAPPGAVFSALRARRDRFDETFSMGPSRQHLPPLRAWPDEASTSSEARTSSLLHQGAEGFSLSPIAWSPIAAGLKATAPKPLPLRLSPRHLVDSLFFPKLFSANSFPRTAPGTSGPTGVAVQRTAFISGLQAAQSCALPGTLTMGRQSLALCSRALWKRGCPGRPYWRWGRSGPIGSLCKGREQPSTLPAHQVSCFWDVAADARSKALQGFNTAQRSIMPNARHLIVTGRPAACFKGPFAALGAIFPEAPKPSFPGAFLPGDFRSPRGAFRSSAASFRNTTLESLDAPDRRSVFRGCGWQELL